MHSHLIRRLPFLVPVDIAQILTSNLDTLNQCLLTLSNPNSRIVLLLVGFIGSLGITDLGHEVVFLLKDKVTDTR